MRLFKVKSNQIIGEKVPNSKHTGSFKSTNEFRKEMNKFLKDFKIFKSKYP